MKKRENIEKGGTREKKIGEKFMLNYIVRLERLFFKNLLEDKIILLDRLSTEQVPDVLLKLGISLIRADSTTRRLPKFVDLKRH